MHLRAIAHLSLKVLVINIIVRPIASPEDKILYSHYQKDRTIVFLRRKR
jgi:hypothetical protein